VVEWLLREGGAVQAVPASRRMSFEDDHWRATIERVEIGDGLRIYLTTAAIRRSLTLEPMQIVPGAWLCSKIAVRGRVAVTFPDRTAIRLAPERSMLFRLKEGKLLFSPSPRQTLQLTGYMLRADRVESLCDDDVPAHIRPLIAAKTQREQLVPIDTTPHLRRVAARMFSDAFTGPLRPVYLEGLALQLFAIHCAIAGGARTTGSLSAGERRLIEEARERLLADMTGPPTSAELAGALGMSERRLNAGFRALFGATMFETLRNERLEHARIVLESEAVPLKTVADRVGYRHVTNFISAFTARFGHPPRQLAPSRRSRRQSDETTGQRG
jgi:AraC-like DNA-binding protein